MPTPPSTGSTTPEMYAAGSDARNTAAAATSSTEPFDPFPHNFLTFVVSLEAVFLSGFIINSQRHIKRLSDQRAHVNLQIDLLAEAEMTKVLQYVGAIARKLGIDELGNDRETQALASETDIEQVARAVHERSE